jgi:hypothetical protein
VTLAPKGLLIEEQRTNLVLRSEEFDNASWVINTAPVTISANATVAPSGATTADKLIVANGELVNSSSTYFYQLVSKAASATTYTVTCYAKTAEYNRFRILVNDNAAVANAVFATWSLVDGSVTEAASATGTFTAASAGAAVNVGNGWYRCALTFTSSTETTLRVRLHPRNSVQATGDGTSGIYLWGAQLEAGAFATSYIPTVASQVTRAADSASMIGNNFARWWNQSAGTMFAQFSEGVTNKPVYRLGSTALASVGATLGASNTIVIDKAGTGGLISTSGYVSAGTKTAFAYDGASMYASTAGGAVGTSATVMTVSTMMGIGINLDLSNPLNGHIQRFAFYPRRLANTELQSITA